MRKLIKETYIDRIEKTYHGIDNAIYQRPHIIQIIWDPSNTLRKDRTYGDTWERIWEIYEKLTKLFDGCTIIQNHGYINFFSIKYNCGVANTNFYGNLCKDNYQKDVLTSSRRTADAGDQFIDDLVERKMEIGIFVEVEFSKITKFHMLARFLIQLHSISLKLAVSTLSKSTFAAIRLAKDNDEPMGYGYPLPTDTLENLEMRYKNPSTYNYLKYWGKEILGKELDDLSYMDEYFSSGIYSQECLQLFWNLRWRIKPLHVEENGDDIYVEINEGETFKPVHFYQHENAYNDDSNIVHGKKVHLKFNGGNLELKDMSVDFEHMIGTLYNKDQYPCVIDKDSHFKTIKMYLGKTYMYQHDEIDMSEYNIDKLMVYPKNGGDIKVKAKEGTTVIVKK